MAVSVSSFGKLPDGREVSLYKISNAKGSYVEVINYGAIIRSIVVPDKSGKMADVVLGLDTIEGYLGAHPYLGAFIGRFGNRIENAEFELNGVTYKVFANDGANHLHGGKVGFDKVLLDTEIVNDSTIKLSYVSVDGEEGYPGTLKVSVTYSFDEENALSLNYVATTDKDTVLNLTNHSYFNLTGRQGEYIGNHTLWLDSDKITTPNAQSIPTGEFTAVEGTPFDFRVAKALGKEMEADNDFLKWAGGYDHNYVLDITGKDLKLVAKVTEPESGRVMEVLTNKPGIQLYTGNYVTSDVVGKRGETLAKRSGFCLETQFYPNSIKHKHFPSPVLKVGEVYDYTTVYKFS